MLGLIAPDGNAFNIPVTIWPVVLKPRAGFLQIDAVPGTPLTVTRGSVSHILNRHSDAARTATLARIAAGESKLSDFENVGYFYLQYSSVAAVIQLIEDVYNASGPPDIGPSRGGGRFALFAGALFLQDTTTKQTMPILIGRSGLNGPPTNIAALFVTPANEVQTMYPAGRVTQFHP